MVSFKLIDWLIDPALGSNALKRQTVSPNGMRQLANQRPVATCNLCSTKRISNQGPAFFSPKQEGGTPNEGIIIVNS